MATLPPFKILHRPAPCGRSHPWSQVATAASREALGDELASPLWPQTHGDLVRCVGPGLDALYVYDGDGVQVLAAPAPFTRAAWEGPVADAVAMMQAAGDRSRDGWSGSCAPTTHSLPMRRSHRVPQTRHVSCRGRPG